MMINKSCCEISVWFSYICNIYIYIYIFDIRLSRFNPSSASKILVKHFLAGVNTKYFWNIPKEKPFFPVRILNLSSLLLIFLLILV